MAGLFPFKHVTASGHVDGTVAYETCASAAVGNDKHDDDKSPPHTTNEPNQRRIT
jgi:hypothetical protein